MSAEVVPRDAERLKFFTDAVVAIAMTLLILPLLESVSEAAAEGLLAPEYFAEHGGQLFSFVLSFGIIATFWLGHERLFTHVRAWTPRLMILNVGWMLSIVFLPVATALVGSMETDRLQIGVYIGTMIASSVLMAGMNLVALRSPGTWSAPDGPPIGGVAAQLALATLFLLALGVALVFPDLNYYALFLLFLTGPLQAVLRRTLPARAVRGRDLPSG